MIPPSLTELKEQLASVEHEYQVLKADGKALESIRQLEKFILLSEKIYGSSGKEISDACLLFVSECNITAMNCLQMGKLTAAYQLLCKAEGVTGTEFIQDFGKKMKLRAATFNNLGCLFKRRGKLNTALDHMQHALTIEQQLSDVENPAGTHLNLCSTYSEMGNHRQALEHAQKALSLVQGQGRMDKGLLAVAFHNVAVEQEHLGHFRPALVSFRHALDVAEDRWGKTHPKCFAIRACYEECKERYKKRQDKFKELPEIRVSGGSNRHPSKTPDFIEVRYRNDNPSKGNANYLDTTVYPKSRLSVAKSIITQRKSVSPDKRNGELLLSDEDNSDNNNIVDEETPLSPTTPTPSNKQTPKKSYPKLLPISNSTSPKTSASPSPIPLIHPTMGGRSTSRFSAQIRVKCYLDEVEDIIMLLLPAKITLNKVEDLVREAHGIDGKFLLKYRDEEGDMITLSSEMGWKCAVEIANRTQENPLIPAILHLYVHKVKHVHHNNVRFENVGDKKRRMDDDVAATKIQALMRGYCSRKHIQKDKQKETEAAIKIQALQRGRKVRKNKKDTNVQSITATTKEEEEAALLIQKMERGRKARMATTEMKKQQQIPIPIPIQIQIPIPIPIPIPSQQPDQKSEADAAVKIQSLYRGGKARQRVQDIKKQEAEELNKAAVKIQALERGRRERARLKQK